MRIEWTRCPYCTESTHTCWHLVSYVEEFQLFHTRREMRVTWCIIKHTLPCWFYLKNRFSKSTFWFGLATGGISLYIPWGHLLFRSSRVLNIIATRFCSIRVVIKRRSNRPNILINNSSKLGNCNFFTESWCGAGSSEVHGKAKDIKGATWNNAGNNEFRTWRHYNRNPLFMSSYFDPAGAEN